MVPYLKVSSGFSPHFPGTRTFWSRHFILVPWPLPPRSDPPFPPFPPGYLGLLWGEQQLPPPPNSPLSCPVGQEGSPAKWVCGEGVRRMERRQVGIRKPALRGFWRERKRLISVLRARRWEAGKAVLSEGPEGEEEEGWACAWRRHPWAL